MGDSVNNECPDSIPEFDDGCDKKMFRQQELFALLALYKAQREGRN